VTPLADRLTASVMFPRGRFDRSYFSLDYALPLGSNGLNLRLGGYEYRAKTQNVNIGGFQATQDFSEQRLTAMLSYPFILRTGHELTGEIGGYAARTGDIFTSPPSSDELDLRANTRALQANLSSIWQAEGKSSDLNLQLTRGLSGAGASQPAPIVDLDFSRTKIFGRRRDDWMNGMFGTFISGVAQYSGSHLPTSEKITFGGLYYGTAYPTGELAGDRGGAVSLEVFKDFKIGEGKSHSIQPYLGVDRASARVNGAPTTREALQSSIIGARLLNPGTFTLNLTAAKPTGAVPLGKTDRPWRFNAQLSVNF
jgi:hemolysin activation/secretion protein